MVKKGLIRLYAQSPPRRDLHDRDRKLRQLGTQNKHPVPEVC